MHRSKTIASVAGGLAALSLVLPNQYVQTYSSSIIYVWGYDHPEATLISTILIGLAVAMIMGDRSKPAGIWRRSICRPFGVLLLLTSMVTCSVDSFDWDLSYGFYVRIIANILLLMSIQEASKAEAIAKAAEQRTA